MNRGTEVRIVAAILLSFRFDPAKAIDEAEARIQVIWDEQMSRTFPER